MEVYGWYTKALEQGKPRQKHFQVILARWSPVKPLLPASYESALLACNKSILSDGSIPISCVSTSGFVFWQQSIDSGRN